MQSRALFWRPSFWSAAVDGLWSVIVPVAWPLSDRLSRWSPSTGGGNESGLRTLLVSAPANTLFVTPSTYLGHLTSFDMMSVSMRVSAPANVGLLVSRNFLQEKKTERLLHGFIGTTYLKFLPPSQFMLSRSSVSKTVRDLYSSCSLLLSVKPPWLQDQQRPWQNDRVANYDHLPSTKVLRKLP